MSFVITFSTKTRMQSFEIRRIEGGLSFTRISHKSTSNRWFAFTTNAYLTTNGSRDGALRSSSEHINFSMGKSSERLGLDDSDLYDSQSDYVYDYESEMNDLHGDGVYVAPKYTSWPICECADPSCVASQRFDEVPF